LTQASKINTAGSQQKQQRPHPLREIAQQIRGQFLTHLRTISRALADRITAQVNPPFKQRAQTITSNIRALCFPPPCLAIDHDLSKLSIKQPPPPSTRKRSHHHTRSTQKAQAHFFAIR